jgi:hypothetical protein
LTDEEMPRRRRLQNIKNFQLIADSDENGKKWKKTTNWREFVR